MDGLEFTVTFQDVSGADKAGEAETLVFSFSSALGNDEPEVSGSGTVLRESGAWEACGFTFEVQ